MRHRGANQHAPCSGRAADRCAVHATILAGEAGTACRSCDGGARTGRCAPAAHLVSGADGTGRSARAVCTAHTAEQCGQPGCGVVAADVRLEPVDRLVRPVTTRLVAVVLRLSPPLPLAPLHLTRPLLRIRSRAGQVGPAAGRPHASSGLRPCRLAKREDARNCQHDAHELAVEVHPPRGAARLGSAHELEDRY